LEYPRIEQRIVEGEAKGNKRYNLESLLLKKIASVKYPMQELELNYPTTKGKVYSDPSCPQVNPLYLQVGNAHIVILGLTDNVVPKNQ
jgi:hypothetical protein